MTNDPETPIGGERISFQPTVWTQILRARDGSETTAVAALGHLVDLYWKPVYFHIRRQGYNIEDAKDLTQQFFARIMEPNALKNVDPAKGKFRTFLLASVRHFLCDEYDKRNALKRTPTLDFEEAQPQYQEGSTFERDWATIVLDRAFAKLREQTPREARVLEAQRTGKTSYRELAEELGATEANIKVMAHRAKKRLRAIILQDLRETVSTEKDAEEELNALFRAFSA